MSSAAVSRDLPIKEVEEETKDDTAAISQNLGLSDGAGADAGANAQDDIVRTGLEPDPESEIGEDAQEDDDSEKVKQALARLPPVNSGYLPLPWKGRLGYACLKFFFIHPFSPLPVLCRASCLIDFSLSPELGVLEYLSTNRDAPDIRLAHLSHRLHSREPLPAAGPDTAVSQDEEPARHFSTTG